MDYQQATFRLSKTLELTPRLKRGKEVGWLVDCEIALFTKRLMPVSTLHTLFPPLAFREPIHGLSVSEHTPEKLFFK